MRPKITDIADLKDVLELRFKPADRAGSAHLMSPGELRAATERARKLFNEGPKVSNRKESLQRFLDEEKKRETETGYDRANRLRERIAWEVAQERKEKSNSWRRATVVRY